MRSVVGKSGRKRLTKKPVLSPTAAEDQKGQWMDEARQNLRAYEYLCRIGEAKGCVF